MLALLALAACAGPSPEIKATSADASAPATAAEGATDGSAAAAAAAAAGTPEEPAENAAADAAASEAAAESSPPASEPPAAGAAEATGAAEAPSEPDVEAAEPVVEPTPSPSPPQPALAVAPSTPAGVGPPGSGLATGRPYVVIRFTDDAGDYQPALAAAVRRAVERRPNVAFDLVAVTPRAGNAEDLADDKAEAEAQAAAVMKSLADLGIGPDRVSMRAWTGQPTDVNEIRLYIR